MAHFEIAFKRTVGLEGGYVNHPDDPGGETKYGVTKRDYPHLDIANLTLEQAKEVYKRDFWDRLRLDQVHDEDIACEVFDTALNTGNATAVRLAQRSCNAMGSNLVMDGFIGPMTIGELNRHSRLPRDRDVLFKALNCLQGEYYVRLTEGSRRRQFLSFFKGWINHRIQLVRSWR